MGSYSLREKSAPKKSKLIPLTEALVRMEVIFSCQSYFLWRYVYFHSHLSGYCNEYSQVFMEIIWAQLFKANDVVS